VVGLQVLLVTLAVHVGYSTGEWPAGLLGDIWDDAIRTDAYPGPHEVRYYCGSGISTSTTSTILAEVVDEQQQAAVVLGRAMVVDQLVDSLCGTPRIDCSPCPNPQSGELLWWRGSLIVRVMNWKLGSRTLGDPNDPNAYRLTVDHFPRNEMWVLPLQHARDGVAEGLRRVVDNSLVP
jgi:hypothetical protein